MSIQTGLSVAEAINDKYNLELAGTGGSNLPDLKQEFSNIPHEKAMRTVKYFVLSGDGVDGVGGVDGVEYIERIEGLE